MENTIINDDEIRKNIENIINKYTENCKIELEDNLLLKLSVYEITYILLEIEYQFDIESFIKESRNCFSINSIINTIKKQYIFK